MLDVREAVRLCDGSRVSLRRQCAALRALVKDKTSLSSGSITSTVATLKAHYRQSLIIHINISRRIAREVELLMYYPAELAKLMQAVSRLTIAQQQVEKLLQSVAKEKAIAD